jgi:hypothetical protein
MNQAPTPTRTSPLHRFTAGPVIRAGCSVSALTVDTTIEAVTSRTAKTSAVVVKAQAVCVAPMVRVWAARPASSGPVHPNPASKYPNP